MTEEAVHNCADGISDERLEKAVEWFLRVRSEDARAEDLFELQRWMEIDPQNALAYQQTAATWNNLGAHASAPEIIIGRRDALEDSRRAVRRRWSARSLSRFGWAAAACVLVTFIAGSWWFVAQRAGVYATARGEHRTVTLEDGSVVTLDAQSRVRVRYTDGERRVILEEGQARFAVAKDPLRPFRVHAREQTVVALGTQFDVELVTGAVLVTLIDGHVAVAGVDPQSLSQVGGADHVEEEVAGAHGSANPRRNRHAEEGAKQRRASERIVELQAGQELRVRGDGRATLVANVNLDRATAWQSGKLFFDNEPLADAAVRINRSARRAIVVDPPVAQLRISGVFNAGDPDAFVEAVTSYLPVQIGSSNETEVQLTARQ
jgi:transmembrane sensor